MNRSFQTTACAAAIYEWLAEREVGDIPQCTEIGRLIAPRLPWQPDGQRVFHAMIWLATQPGLITLRYSRRCNGEPRRQIAVRLLQHDKVLKTTGCTFDAPAAPGATG